MNKQKQVDRFSGYIIHPNLDDVSRNSLMTAQGEHSKHGGNFSQSVMVRRAVRFYCEHLQNMTPDEYRFELMESNRAAKGVM